MHSSVEGAGLRPVSRSPIPSRQSGELQGKFGSVEEELKREREVNKLLRDKMMKLRSELDVYYHEERENLIDYYEKRVGVLKQEMDENNMSASAGLAQDERNIYEEAIGKLNQDNTNWKIKFVMMGAEVERLVDVLTQISQEVGEWMNKCHNYEQQLEIASRQSNGLAKEERAQLEQHISALTAENQRLQSTIHQRKRQSDAGEEKISALETEVRGLRDHERRASSFMRENDGLKQEIQRLKELLSQQENSFMDEIENLRKSGLMHGGERVKWDAEKASLESLILQMRHRETDNETRMKMLASDNERVQHALQDRENELERLKQRNRELESGHFQEVEDLRLQLEAYKKANFDARELTLRFGSEKVQFETQIRQQKQLLENAKVEIAKMTDLLGSLRSENERLKEDADRIRRDQYTLMNEKNQFENEATKRGEKISMLQKDLEAMKQARDGYKNELERNGGELTRRQQELGTRLQEIEVLQRKYEEVIRGSASQGRDVSPMRPVTGGNTGAGGYATGMYGSIRSGQNSGYGGGQGGYFSSGNIQHN